MKVVILPTFYLNKVLFDSVWLLNRKSIQFIVLVFIIEANAHEPFHLLGMIYEELQDTEKSLQVNPHKNYPCTSI